MSARGTGREPSHIGRISSWRGPRVEKVHEQEAKQFSDGSEYISIANNGLFHSVGDCLQDLESSGKRPVPLQASLMLTILVAIQMMWPWNSKEAHINQSKVICPRIPTIFVP